MHTRYLSAEDIPKIAELPDYATSREALHTRLQNRNCCIGLFSRNTLVAFTWCDLEECNFHGCRFRLLSDEGYLYDAHTLKEFRGKGLAPYVRHAMYRELKKTGRIHLYSITERFNESALRFKQKLAGRIIARGTYVNLFHKCRFTYGLTGDFTARLNGHQSPRA